MEEQPEFELKSIACHIKAWRWEDGVELLAFSKVKKTLVGALLTRPELRALFRYLANLLLPSVTQGPLSSFQSRPCSGTGVWLTNGGKYVGTLGKCYTPEGARALAACLLAAADEAEKNDAR